ncbi:hypothetical protein DY000_02049172 [Brassica cretica]|uniref:Uncharacterized protein n=1 Tax=Brassica cretica TaxID=69181 RepID=A0ABQ7F5C6_BRACR|nr:hypothetical protein DY000_02049172 [Brassica cretica]
MRSSKVARPGRKGKDDLREKGIRREKGNYVKWNKGRRCPLQDIGSQESPEEIIETPDSVLMGDSKNLKKHYQGWVLYRETVSHLGPKKKFQPTKNPKDELLECCPARGIPAENEQPWQDPDLRVPIPEAFWSPVSSTPVSAPGTASGSKKRQIADKENLPYFRIWKTSIYSNRQEPTYRRLYKRNPNPRMRDRHF